MIFTLFIISALALSSFETTNACTINNAEVTGVAACPKAATDADCMTQCKDGCEKDTGGTSQAVCEGAIPCWNGAAATHAEIKDKAACEAVHAGTPKLNCIPNCMTFCSGGSRDAAECKAALKCDGDLGVDDIAPCKAFCTANAGTYPTLSTLCTTKLPCDADFGYKDERACTKAIGGTDYSPADPACFGACKTFCDVSGNLDSKGAQCKAAMPCYDVSDTTKVDACDTWCKTGAGKANTGNHCSTQLPCKQAETAKTLVQACPLGKTNIDCATQCDTNCKAESGTTNQAVCEANLVCFDGATHKYLADQATCDKLASTTPIPSCEAQCTTFCKADTAAAQKTLCEKALPCWDGSADKHDQISGKPACTKMKGEGADPRCVAPCGVYCGTTDIAEDLTLCDEVLPCWDKTTKKFIENLAACTAVNGTPPDATCVKSCETFCTGEKDATNKGACEKVLPCFDGTTSHKYYTGADACTKFNGSPSIATCKDTCDAFCGTNPCDATKKTPCSSQCTAWCAVEANKEDALCKPDGGSLSVVVSIFLLLIALL